MKKGQKSLLKVYEKEVAEFRNFCIEHAYNGQFDEQDFYSLSLGFFIALGVTGDINNTGDKFADAFSLAVACRYNLQYWEGQSL